MAGDTDNVAVWSEADVLVGSLTATNPTAGAEFLLNNSPRVVTVGTTNASTAITAASGTFSTTQDVGASITGTGIPVGATLSAVGSTTSATLSAAATATGASVSATITRLPGQWDFAGILDGSAGFNETQANDSTDFNGWGVGVVATSRKNLVITRTFTVLEDNATTLGLRYDTSGLVVAGDGYSGTLAGRDLSHKFKIAFETRTSDTVKRLISKNHAEIDSIGDVTEGEDNTASFPITVKIYPDANGEFWQTWKGAAA